MIIGNLRWVLSVAKTTEDMLVKIVDKLDDLQKSIHGVDKEVALQKAGAMERSFDIKSLQDEVKVNNQILQENTTSLQEHMMRTDLLEKAVFQMDQRLTPIEKDKIEQEAIARHRKEMIVRWAKLIGILAALGGMVAAAKPLLLFILTL